MVSGGVGCCRGLGGSEEKSRDLRLPGMTFVRARRRVAIERTLNGIKNEHNVRDGGGYQSINDERTYAGGEDEERENTRKS